MFTRTLRQSFRRQEGQALVLAALMMLVMSVAVLTTVNIGHTVHERIRLQNTADSAAYSMAAMEARAFNFYAYANRTQVSHYVSAMLWQSLLSLIYFTEAFLADTYGFMKTLNPCVGKQNAFWKVACPILKLIPVVGQVLKVIETAINAWRTVVLLFHNMIRGLNPDKLVGKFIIPTHWVLNSVLFFASQAVMMSASTHVLQTTDTVIADNDKNINSLFSQGITGAISQCLFDQAHMEEAGGRPLSTPRNPFEPINPEAWRHTEKEARAKRAMGGISNGTRYACDTSGGLAIGGMSLLECQEKFITSRRLGDLIPLPSWLGIIGEWLNNEVDIPLVFQFGKLGQTRLLTYNNPNRDKVTAPRKPRNFIRDWREGIAPSLASMAQGDNMGSDDLYWMKFGPESFGPFTNPLACKDDERDVTRCWGDPRKGLEDGNAVKMPYKHMMKTSIWAMNASEGSFRDGGVHWRVHPQTLPTGDGSWRTHRRPRGPDGDVGVTRTKVCAMPGGACFLGIGEMDVYTANVHAAEDGNHPWKGVIPFMHFEPGQFEGVCGRTAGAGAAPRYRFDFNQPSTWVALNKSPDEIINRDLKEKEAGTNAPALLNPDGKIRFGFAEENDDLEMKNNRKKFLSFSEGLNVITRGQTYYHRPGNWTEHPNFFNPYWRPRLASVFQGRHNLPLVGELNDRLPGPMKGLAPKIITH
ncbi:TadE/TadG family type IV pilus assembly protein [Myxococcus sp. RHSTA-1-4]|uniref:TadE/TadG family type IV pilus assembly protein n=1 Tax=Myxococcus sp. RHSTA-1-4 TaxID=2874601 RepID=UPI001CBB9C78|nr:Tad domain-containing protein [Myxococcus sp. RHSTA-1-4]MBZ4417733.1 Tad domain-containing protein [Myxococcus sp. RHSTA-1-4]